MLRVAIAAAATVVAVGVAPAETITARDGAGTVYQLIDDGTWAIVVTGADGKTYLLSPGGGWLGNDEAAGLLQRFDALLEAAFAKPGAPNVDPGDWPKYKACLLAAFRTLPIAGQRILVSASDPREAFNKLKEADPDSARIIETADQACRQGIKLAE